MALTKVFRSTHTGAPGISGEAGAMQELLDAVLVDGYNPKTITITRSGTTASASCTSHGFLAEQVIAISGADQADYNGEFRITNVTTDGFDFTVANSPTTPATGTITAKVAPLGWSIAYESGNDRSYAAPSGANSFYLNVSDGSAGNQFRVRVFSTVTAAGAASGNGTDPVPTDGQSSGGGYTYTTSAAGATERPWIVIGTTRGFAVLTDPSGGANYFGGFLYSDLAGGVADSSQSALIAQAASYSSSWMYDSAPNTATPSNSFAYVTNGRAGATGSVRVAPYCVGTSTTFGYTTNGSLDTYGVEIAPLQLYEPTAGIWATVPGLWGPLTRQIDLFEGDTFEGALGSSLAGRSFEIRKRANTAILCLETSDTVW